MGSQTQWKVSSICRSERSEHGKWCSGLSCTGKFWWSLVDFSLNWCCLFLELKKHLQQEILWLSHFTPAKGKPQHFLFHLSLLFPGNVWPLLCFVSFCWVSLIIYIIEFFWWWSVWGSGFRNRKDMVHHPVEYCIFLNLSAITFYYLVSFTIYRKLFIL